MSYKYDVGNKPITRVQANRIIEEHKSLKRTLKIFCKSQMKETKYRNKITQNKFRSWAKWRRDVSNFMSEHRNYLRYRSNQVDKNAKLKYASSKYTSKLIGNLCKSLGSKAIKTSIKKSTGKCYLYSFTQTERKKLKKLLKYDLRKEPIARKDKIFLCLTHKKRHKLMALLNKK